MRYCLLCLVAFLFPFAGHAETTSYTCKFPLVASPKGLSKESTPFDLRFVADAAAKKAYLLGNNGSAEVHAIENRSGVTFLEVTATGNVMATAITHSGDAVHSRNSILNDKLIPAQYYGKCNIQ